MLILYEKENKMQVKNTLLRKSTFPLRNIYYMKS